jgi:Uma2 family endonuclease
MGSRRTAAMQLHDFLALREAAAPGGLRYEAVGGRPVVDPAPGGPHQNAVAALLEHLRPAARRRGLSVLTAPWDWVLRQVPALTLRQPDLVVVTREQARRPRLTSAPFMVVEVLSPATRNVDLVEKRREYATARVGSYWLVDLDVPAVDVLTLDRSTGRYAVTATARGDAPLTVSDPFPVTVVPAELLV